MTQRRMVRSLLAVLVLTLLAAPAAVTVAGPAAEAPRSGWSIDLGELVSRAWGLLFGDRVGENGSSPALGERGAGEPGSLFGADSCDAECEARGSSDPDG